MSITKIKYVRELWMGKLIKTYSKLELPKITPDDVTFI